MASHVLVGGGTGFVGRHLVHCLRESGAKVSIITRRIENGPNNITWNQIRDHGLPKETTAVVNVAGRNILDPTFWTESFKRDVYDSRIETNRILVEAIENSKNKIKAFVTISGVGYYKPSDIEEYDENWSQTSLRDNSSKDYLMNLANEWENSSKLIKDSTTRRIIIRSGVVLGHDGGIIKQLKLPFSLGLGGPLGNGNQWFPWIHVNDLVNMFKFAILNDNVTGVINGVAKEQVRNREFVKALGIALNRPAVIPMPAFVVEKLFGNDRAGILLNGQKVKSKAGSLGFEYEFPNLQEACINCVNPHKHHHKPKPHHHDQHKHPVGGIKGDKKI